MTRHKQLYKRVVVYDWSWFERSTNGVGEPLTYRDVAIHMMLFFVTVPILLAKFVQALRTRRVYYEKVPPWKVSA